MSKNNVIIRRVSDGLAWRLKHIGEGIMAESWGEKFPMQAEHLLQGADVVFEAVDLDDSDQHPIGSAAITRRNGCPGNPGDTNPYFVCWWVSDGRRRKGIGNRLRAAAIKAAKKAGHKLLYTTTDGLESTRALLSGYPLWLPNGGWTPLEPITNEDGSPAIKHVRRLGWR